MYKQLKYLDHGGGGERKGRVVGDGVGEDEFVGEIGAYSALKALQTHSIFFFHDEEGGWSGLIAGLY